VLDDHNAKAWSRLAHALARTDRVSDAIDACERSLRLADDPEVADVLERLREQLPRVLPAA
jgi:cytochrome c-type biogenesis protein CcmH/NrfG